MDKVSKKNKFILYLCLFETVSTMKKFLALAIIGIAAAACGTPKMDWADASSFVNVTSSPAVLEAVADEIDATLTISYPKGYFNPKAILEVTPVLVYEGGEAALRPIIYQGEKVKDNHKAVAADGQTFREKVRFDYVEGMEKSHLELRGVVRYKDKAVALPIRKVADGVNTTYMLVKDGGFLASKADNYQDVITESAESQIKYLVNSSDVRASELKSQDIQDFLALLDDIQSNGKAKITSTEIVSYASPEGKQDRNDKLSADRGASARRAWDKLTAGMGAQAPDIKSVGEDWEGFQKLVRESNIEDKDLILRVLSMYSDPAVRENEIRNMSQVFTELKGGVLPELRRSRLIANIEVQNYTEEELLQIVKETPGELDEESLLRVATLVKDPAQKEHIYRLAVENFDSPRAKYNLAVLYLGQNKTERAGQMLARLDKNDKDVQNALGVIALRQRDLGTAARLFQQSGTEQAKANLGIVHILDGSYDQAVKDLEGLKGCPHNLVLAYILTDQLDKAKAAAKCKDPKVAYLRAIIAARQGDGTEWHKNLETATAASEALAARAAKDIEFADFNL